MPINPIPTLLITITALRNFDSLLFLRQSDDITPNPNATDIIEIKKTVKSLEDIIF